MILTRDEYLGEQNVDADDYLANNGPVSNTSWHNDWHKDYLKLTNIQTLYCLFREHGVKIHI